MVYVLLFNTACCFTVKTNPAIGAGCHKSLPDSWPFWNPLDRVESLVCLAVCSYTSLRLSGPHLCFSVECTRTYVSEFQSRVRDYTHPLRIYSPVELQEIENTQLA